MSRFDSDALGNRMKFYEQLGFSRSYMVPGESFLVRLDGRSFSNFTKEFNRPFDIAMARAMESTMRRLVEEFNASVGYCQSDEITLAWISNSKRELMFGGRVQKILSLLSARASVIFNIEITKRNSKAIVEGREPIMDARLVPVPSRGEALNCILWRQQDATKNAISMAAQEYFTYKELLNKSGPEKQEMLFASHNINFNDYPDFFKRGAFARRMEVQAPIEQTTLDRMPPELAAQKKDVLVTRRKVELFDCWITKAGDTFEDKFKAVFGFDINENM